MSAQNICFCGEIKKESMKTFWLKKKHCMDKYVEELICLVIVQLR